MKIFYLLCLMLCMSIIGYTQILTIKDSENGQALELVTLSSITPKSYTLTNANGQTDISAFEGALKIEVRLLGYKTKIRSYSELESAQFEIELTPSSLNIDEVVISATRWNQVSNNVPSKIISISPKEIYLQNPQTAADMLASTGEVFIQKSQQGGGSPMIRGFATNRLLYTVDGVRMNTAIFRGGNIQNVISMDPFSIEHTEVFFGPGSVIYGSDAIGGIMSFQTLTPQLSLNDKSLITGKALTRYSSANDEKTAHFNVSIGRRKWAMVSSISTNDYGDLRMGSNGPDEYLRPFYVQRQDSIDVVVTNNDPKVQRPSGYSQINMMQKLRFKPNEKWDLQYGFHYSETSEYARYDRQVRYKNGLPRYGEWNYGPQKWMMNNLQITHSGSNILYDQVTIRLAQQFFEESRVSRGFNKNTKETRIEEVVAYSANIDFVKFIGNRNELFYGIEVVQNDVVSTGFNIDISDNREEVGASRYPKSDWSSYALYLSDQYAFSDKFRVQGGVRYNLYQLNAKFDTTFYPFPFTKAEINDGAFTGSFGFVYKPQESWIISANGATAFRSPNVDDVGKVFDSEPGSVVVPNPNLNAEYAYNVDVGIAKIFGDFLKIDLTAYYTILQNAMVRRDFTLNGLDSIMYDGEMSKVQAIQNAAVANVFGVQAGIEVKLPSGFGFSSDFNYQKGEEELDDGTTSPSRHAPPWFGNSKLKYHADKLELQFYAIYSGEKTYAEMPEGEKAKAYIYAVDKDGNPYSPGWYTLNFKAMYKLTAVFTVSAGLENITDQRYRTYSSGIVAPGRNFILSLKADF